MMGVLQQLLGSGVFPPDVVAALQRLSPNDAAQLDRLLYGASGALVLPIVLRFLGAKGLLVGGLAALLGGLAGSMMAPAPVVRRPVDFYGTPLR